MSDKDYKQELQVDAKKHYQFGEYADFARWSSYWHQLDETFALKPETVLVIGIGDDIVCDVLRKHGLKVYTFDFDKSLNPDFVGNVTDIDQILSGKQFDVILCCQILEHLPYDMFESLLQKISTLSNNVILSLPYAAIGYKFDFKLPIIKNVRFDIRIHQFYRKVELGGEHYWEIGLQGYPKKKIIRSIKKVFVVKKRYVALHNQYHLFFILEKIK